MKNLGFKCVSNVSSSTVPFGKVSVSPNGRFSRRVGVLCNPAVFHVVPFIGSRQISSAARMEIGSFDEFAKKTTGVDIAIISEGPELLHSKLTSSPFGFAEIEGEYRDSKIQNCEILFVVTNANSGVPTKEFFDFIVGLGREHGQQSVLLKPAKDIVYNGKQFAREIAYWYYCQTGKVGRQGWLRKKTLEEWIALGNKKSVEGTKFDGNIDRAAFTGSSFIITSVDFSNLAFGGTGSWSNNKMECRYRDPPVS